MAQDRVVMCMKWGTLYPPEYVNVLYSAARKNITGPFRFVCLTSEAEGLHPDIEHYPIPDLGLQQRYWDKGGWAKLSVFAKDLYGLTGRCLFIDLDMVIWNNIDAFFDFPGEIVSTDMGPNWKPKPGNGPKLTGTCIFAFTLGQNPEILDRFMADQDGMVARDRIEQVYIGNEAREMNFWPPEWVISFKYHLRRPVGIGLFLPPKPPGPENKVLAFHGVPRPIDLIRDRWWGIAPNTGRGPVKWMRDYWVEHGGTV